MRRVDLAKPVLDHSHHPGKIWILIGMHNARPLSVTDHSSSKQEWKIPS
jgi:hypothetical protein